jgi:hypothetical protein
MVVGIAFALRPTERLLALMRPLSLAGIFAAVSNVFLGLANAFQALASPGAGQSPDIQLLGIGLAEAAVFPFAAFACLTVAWLSVAIGMRRQP